MVFIGLKALKIPLDFEGGTSEGTFKDAKVIHFNPHFIKLIDEKKMRIIMDDNTAYRIDGDSISILLSALYGDESDLER